MAEVNVGAIEFCEGEGALPMFGRGAGVAVVADHELMFVREFANAFVVVILLGNLGGDGAATQDFGEIENVVEIGIGHSENAIDFDNLDENAGVFVFLSEFADSIHRDGFAPFGEVFGGSRGAAGGDGVARTGQDFGSAKKT